MTSITITQTVTYSPVTPVSLTPARLTNRQTLNALNGKLDELFKLLPKYKTWTDHFSNKCTEECEKILLKVIPEDGDDRVVQEIRIEAGKEIYRLFHEVLINPISRLPYKKPMLDRINGLVWEEEMLKLYLTESIQLPFPMARMTIDAVPHLFGQELIAWGESVKLLVIDPTSSELLMSTAISVGTLVPFQTALGLVANNPETLLGTLIFTCHHLAQEAITVLKHEKQTKQLECASNMIKELTIETRLRIKKEADESKQICDAAVKELETKTKSTLQIHQKTVDGLRSEIVECNNRIQLTNQRLALEHQRTATAFQMAVSADQRTSVQAAETRLLRNTIAQQAYTIHELGRKVDKKRICVIQ